jgi:pyrroloquinoline quinone (PQQ) biosynthesis protein C
VAHDFFERIDAATAPAREKLRATRLGRAMLTATIPLEAYKGYLRETYHFVRHTPRFLAAAASRFDYHLEGVRKRFLAHATEEFGHERLALKDLETLGVDPAAVRASEPLIATSALVAFHYYMAEHVNPVGLFGTIYTLEGLGQSEGAQVCPAIRRALDLPAGAVTFLSSHAELDVAHLAEARKAIAEHVRAPEDARAIIYASRAAFELYAFMFDQIWERFEAAERRSAVAASAT